MEETLKPVTEETTIPMKPTHVDKVPLDNRLTFGVNKKGTELFLPVYSRYCNTVVMGTKGTGKSSYILPMFFEQDLKRKSAGVTIITCDKGLTYFYYSIARKYRPLSRIHLIKPTLQKEVQDLMNQNAYDYDYINESIINYKEAIKHKDIVIIDMEVLTYQKKALYTLGKLMKQLETDIQQVDVTNKEPHFLYIDEAIRVLPYCRSLITHSDTFQLGIIMFFSSRHNMIYKKEDWYQVGSTYDYRDFLDENVRNYFLCSHLTPADVDFYQRLDMTQLRNCEANGFTYEFMDVNGGVKTGHVSYEKCMLLGRDSYLLSAKKNKTQLEKRSQTDKPSIKGQGKDFVKTLEPISVSEKVIKEIEKTKPVKETSISLIDEDSLDTLQIEDIFESPKHQKKKKKTKTQPSESETLLSLNDILMEEIPPSNTETTKQSKETPQVKVEKKENTFKKPKKSPPSKPKVSLDDELEELPFQKPNKKTPQPKATDTSEKIKQQPSSNELELVSQAIDEFEMAEELSQDDDIVIEDTIEEDATEEEEDIIEDIVEDVEDPLSNDTMNGTMEYCEDDFEFEF